MADRSRLACHAVMAWMAGSSPAMTAGGGRACEPMLAAKDGLAGSSQPQPCPQLRLRRRHRPPQPAALSMVREGARMALRPLHHAEPVLGPAEGRTRGHGPPPPRSAGEDSSFNGCALISSLQLLRVVDLRGRSVMRRLSSPVSRGRACPRPDRGGTTRRVVEGAWRSDCRGVARPPDPTPSLMAGLDPAIHSVLVACDSTAQKTGAMLAALVQS